MAALAAIEAELNGVPADIRTRLLGAFREVLKMRIGHPDVTKAVRSENISAGLVPGRPGTSSAGPIAKPIKALPSNVKRCSGTRCDTASRERR